jgi:hypothetical protein
MTRFGEASMKCRTTSLIVVSLLLLSCPHDAHSQAQQAPTGSDAPQSGGGGVDAATANNPAAPLIQIQLQSWYHPAYDGTSGQGNDFLLRPILPFNPKGIIPSSIIRPQLTLTSTPNGRTGLGDIQLLAVVFPGWHPTARFKVGIGSVIVAPSATNRYAGQGQWQVGPAAVFIFTGVKHLVLGAIADNPITVTGERSRPGVNALTLEPLVIKTWGKGYFVRFDPYCSFNWKEHGSAILPINLGVGRLLKIRGQLVNAYIQPEFLARNEPYAGIHPPRVTLRFAMALIYPKKNVER